MGTFVFPVSANAESLTIRGSTTVLPIAQKAAERYMNLHPQANISVSGGGSGTGVKALLDGSIDIADASRPMKAKEVKIARKRGITPCQYIIAKDGIAVIVHPKNPLSALTKAQIKEIYTGKIKNWTQLGGFKKEMVVVSRETTSGTFECFNKIVLKKAKVTPYSLLQAANAGVLQTVAQSEGAIGYVGIGYLDKRIKAIKVEGVYPTVETVIDGTYPISRPLFMYTNGKPKGLCAMFIDFVLSPKGQKIVEEEGFVKVR
ncbi:MAG: phosphate ABC transporter substrate-binding protein [Deltaproteobacteria bacterium]|nr:phosphate ABC transporter substrate-binding protein [Deltaproteobacteria bacterium]